MAISIVLADVVIAHFATRVLISFTTFISNMFLVVRGAQAIPLKPTMEEDILTFSLGPLAIFWLVLGFWKPEGVFKIRYTPIMLLPEGEAQNQGNSALPEDLPYQDNIESERDRRKIRNRMARLRRRISHVPFIREPGRLVPKYYLLSYTGILAGDSVCLYFWIRSATLFPWEKHWWELELAASSYVRPSGTTIVWPNNTSSFVPDGTMKNITTWSPEQIQNWSTWWWPAMMFEAVNLLIFTIISIAEWTLLVWPLALQWRGLRPNARNQRPNGRRAIIAYQTEITHQYQDEDSPSNELSQAGVWQHVDGIEQTEMIGGMPVTQDVDGIELAELPGGFHGRQSFA